MRLFAPDPGVMVVTFEEALLRGPLELRRSSTATSTVSATYSRGTGPPYPLTLVLERRENR
jgi:hypothetical protein